LGAYPSQRRSSSLICQCKLTKMLTSYLNCSSVPPPFKVQDMCRCDVSAWPVCCGASAPPLLSCSVFLAVASVWQPWVAIWMHKDDQACYCFVEILFDSSLYGKLTCSENLFMFLSYIMFQCEGPAGSVSALLERATTKRKRKQKIEKQSDLAHSSAFFCSHPPTSWRKSQ
jgi:hypothetical protein